PIARKRGRSHLAGARVLARSPAHRPQLADAQARREPAPRDAKRRACGSVGDATHVATSPAPVTTRTTPSRPSKARISVVVPVKDGARYLEELLDALAREAVDEVLIIDSGSRDGSRDIARRAGADLLEIPAEEFGHGRTRNLGAERTSGELICFLTQDA